MSKLIINAIKPQFINFNFSETTEKPISNEGNARPSINELSNISFGRDIVTNRPQTDGSNDFAARLSKLKGKRGKPLLSRQEINRLIQGCEQGTDGKPIKNAEAKISAVLNNPDESYKIGLFQNKAVGILNAIKNPSDKTIRKNPESFADRLTSYSESKDFVLRLLGMEMSQGQPYLSVSEINELIKGCQKGTNGKPIENYEAKIDAVLNAPQELLKISLSQNKAVAILSAIKKPTEQTIRENPDAFADRMPHYSESKDFVLHLSALESSKGQPYLSLREIDELISACQKGTNGKPIENYEAKIDAILKAPQELLKIALYQNKATGILRAINNPLASTVKANPELFPKKSQI